MAFDIEFVSEGRFIPELSLLQVAWGPVESPHVAAIDFLAVGRDGIQPLFALLEDPAIEVVAHSARQDLGLLATRYQVSVAGLWDTQIAAAFAGLGEQIGCAKLVQGLTGGKLDKSQQFTAWLTRPLTARQVRYALDDVRYLPAVWAELRRRLVELGRLEWVREESARLAAGVGPPGPPEVAYQDVKGWRNLGGAALGSLRALAAWRLEQALAENKPMSWIVPDRAMLELCRRGPESVRELRAVRGVGEGTARRYGVAMLAAMAEGAKAPPPAPPPRSDGLSPRAQVWSAVISSLVQARCLAANIAPRLVGARDDAETLAAWFDSGDRAREPDVELLTGWRRELAGEAVLAWLQGRSVIAATEGAGALVLLEDVGPESSR